MRILSVSPGGCHTTNAYANSPWLFRYTNVDLQMRIVSLFSLSHSPAVGAQRYVDALSDSYPFESGTFVASRRWATGGVCDQADSHPDLYANPELQVACAAAVRAVVAA